MTKIYFGESLESFSSLWTEYLEFFNNHLIRLDETGVRKKLLEKWNMVGEDKLATKISSKKGEEDSLFGSSMGYPHVVFSFLVLAGGASAVGIAVFESVSRPLWKVAKFLVGREGRYTTS